MRRRRDGPAPGGGVLSERLSWYETTLGDRPLSTGEVGLRVSSIQVIRAVLYEIRTRQRGPSSHLNLMVGERRVMLRLGVVVIASELVDVVCTVVLFASILGMRDVVCVVGIREGLRLRPRVRRVVDIMALVFIFIVATVEEP